MSNVINDYVVLAGIRGQQNSMNLKELVGSDNILFQRIQEVIAHLCPFSQFQIN
jgi:hypothetical protein